MSHYSHPTCTNDSILSTRLMLQIRLSRALWDMVRILWETLCAEMMYSMQQAKLRVLVANMAAKLPARLLSQGSPGQVMVVQAEQVLC